jgi:hypothetical protein
MPQFKIDRELEKCLPPLPEETYQSIKNSISKDGYDPAKPIVIWEERPNTIVDGHHRYKACRELGVEPVAIEESFKTLDDAILYTLKRQTEQRDLTAAQKVIIAEQMMTIEEKIRLEKEAKESHTAKLNRDESGRFEPSPAVTAENGVRSTEVAKQIAEKAGVGIRRVYEVHAVEKKGVPEVKEMLKSGSLGSMAANQFVQNVPQEKQAIIVKGGPNAVRQKVKEIDKEKSEEEEMRKFQEFNKKVEQRTAAAFEKIDRAFKAANGGCLLPNVSELWCASCQWGFDVYLPLPAEPSCPYCGKPNPTKRDADWNSREV